MARNIFYFLDSNQEVQYVNFYDPLRKFPNQDKFYGIGWVNDNLEVGFYECSTKSLVRCPYICKNIMINKISKTVHPEYPNYRIYGSETFQIDITVFSNENKFDSVEHSFVIRNGIDFFLDSVIRYLNVYTEELETSENIDWDFLDRLGLEFDCNEANGQIYRRFNNYKVYYVETINRMKWTLGSYSTPNYGRISPEFWNTCEISFLSSVIDLSANSYNCDKYLLSLMKECLQQMYRYVRLNMDEKCFYIEQEKYGFNRERLIAEMIVYVVGKFNEKDRIIKLLSKCD